MTTADLFAIGKRMAAPPAASPPARRPVRGVALPPDGEAGAVGKTTCPRWWREQRKRRAEV